MCSVGDDYEDDVKKFIPTSNKIFLSGNKCNKCREESAYVVLRSKHGYCKNCFISGTTHKFKSLLGKHRIITQNENVLVYHKGGHASTALLHFLRSGLDLKTPKQLRLKPLFLYIEDCFELSIDQRNDILDNIQKEITSYGFSVYFVSLLSYISNPTQIADYLTEDRSKLCPTDDDQAKLGTVINKKTSLTNYSDILQVYIRRLLIDIAKYLDCKCVFTPEISEDIAAQLLTNVALGRGFNLPMDIGFCDTRDSDVRIVRPLRVFDIKELAFYNIFNNLEPVSIPYKMLNPYASIQNLMEKFVKDLQVNYPSTITTVMKTGDKLTAENSKQISKCKLCQGSIEDKTSELTAAESTTFSHLFSTQAVQEDNYGTVSINLDAGVPKYCYACNKISSCMLNVPQ